MNRIALPNARYLQSISISSAIVLLFVLQGCGTGSSNILPSPASNSDGYISISGAHFMRNGVVWSPHGINCVAFNATPSTRSGLFGAAYNNFNAAELAAMKAWGAELVRRATEKPPKPGKPRLQRRVKETNSSGKTRGRY